LFVLEELEVDRLTLELGARWERRELAAPGTSLPERSFEGLSASGGVTWKTAGNWAVALAFSHTTRLPTADELYTNGPHLTVFQFEVGDPNLRKERGSSVEGSIRRTEGRVRGKLGLFTSDFEDYIFLTPTGNTIPVDRAEVPEYVTIQRNASYDGAEAQLGIDLWRAGSHRLTLDLEADTVLAEIEPTGQPLPRIPPARASLGLGYDGPRYWLWVESIRVAEQDRVALFEAPTDGYELLNAGGGLRIDAGSIVHEVLVGMTNLTDELARNHLSSLKDLAPLPGRDVRFAYKVRF
jgi:iron complex outermembrane receptor protein